MQGREGTQKGGFSKGGRTSLGGNYNFITALCR